MNTNIPFKGKLYYSNPIFNIQFKRNIWLS
jgi:hypothetical protein